MIDDKSNKGNLSENEWVFITIKENNHVPTDSTSCMNVEEALAARVQEKNEWVIDSGCSHHMIGDKSKFVSLENYDGGVVIFGDDKSSVIHARGSISFVGDNIDDVLYVEGLKHNLLSVG